MKKTITLLSATLLGLTSLAQTEPMDTDNNGYRNVSTLDHLRWITENSSSFNDNFELDNDIDASATSSWTYYTDITGFKPIATGFSIAFRGIFDGKGHTISNLYIDNNKSIQNYKVGLFGKTTDATIKNLTLENCTIKSHTGGASALIGNSNSTIIENCIASGTVEGQDNTAGLISYANDNTITNCSSSVEVVSSYNYVGGLIGQTSNNTTVNNCFATGDATGNDNVGGLIGRAKNSTITNAYATGNITSDSEQIGGFVGQNEGSSISDCYAIGNVVTTGQASPSVGGFCGFNNMGTITLCYALGNVTTEDTKAGGFVGSNNGEISKSYATGNVEAESKVGGFVGDNHASTGIIENCYSRGSVKANGSGYVYTGGFVGKNANQGTTNNCYSTGYVSAPNTSFTDIGGFVGDNNNSAPQNYRGVVNDCYWDVSTSGMSTSDAGNGETTSNLKVQNTFLNWDFSSIWTIEASKNDGYPHLGLYTVGIKEINNIIEYSVYPNPATNFITIKTNNENLINTIKIFDLTGKLILQENKTVSKINISHLKAGVYFIQINNNSEIKKIIKS